MEYAAKRVNNVMHDISILEPMARSSSYDFTRADVDEMFNAIQSSLDSVREEYYRKFEAKAKTTKQAFSFGQSVAESEVSNDFSIAPVENVSEVETTSTTEGSATL
jgi:hypothetical protein